MQIKVYLVKRFPGKPAAAFSTDLLLHGDDRTTIGTDFQLLHRFRAKSVLLHALHADLFHLLPCHLMTHLLRIEAVCRSADKIFLRK